MIRRNLVGKVFEGDIGLSLIDGSAFLEGTQQLPGIDGVATGGLGQNLRSGSLGIGVIAEKSRHWALRRTSTSNWLGQCGGLATSAELGARTHYPENCFDTIRWINLAKLTLRREITHKSGIAGGKESSDQLVTDQTPGFNPKIGLADGTTRMQVDHPIGKKLGHFG